MNWKKVIKSVIMLSTLAVVMVLPTIVNATTQYMGVVPFMTNGSPEEPSMGYAINNQAIIWNLVKYASSEATTYSTIDNVYCVKAGVGFADSGINITDLKEPYDVFYDIKKDRENIKKQNEVLRTLVENTITKDGKTISCYDALLAVLDMLYLPGESNPEEVTNINNKILQLAKTDDDYIKYRGLWNQRYTLTENDIEAVQQAVIWYFTNYYKIVKTESFYSETTEHETKYDMLDKQQWLYYKLTSMTSYDRLANYTPNGEQPQYDAGQARTNQAEILYQYMIKTAIQKAEEYTNATSLVGAPVTVNKNALKTTVEGDRCVVGPINITKQNPTPYTIKIKVNEKENNYQLVNETEIPTGKDFYISIPKSEVNNLKVDIIVNYSDTTMTLMASSTNNQAQPLVEIHKENRTEIFTLEPEKVLLPESFDLALRKFVSHVNKEPVAKRIDVDVSNLNKVDQNGNIIATTAQYKENKPPVSVAKGDIVTYTFRIYNEGTVDGYAQEITEDIPEGLEFLWSEKEGEELKADTTLTAEEKEAIEFNQRYLWGKFVFDDKKERIIKISSDYLSSNTSEDNLITAFGRNDGTKTEEDLKYKEIAVRLKVVSEDTRGSIIRNEAAITEDADKDKKTVEDRDSKPEEWKEHPNHEDDEDHDYIILQSFDLALRKFIIAVSKDTKIENEEYLKNEDGSYVRAPKVDTSKLNTIGEDGKIITTAIYTHTKEPIIVQPNDIVVYMIRVYNEGDVNGYAAQIKDHLPPQLEYVESDLNKEYGWSVSEDGRTVITNYLSAEKYLIQKAKTTENENIELSYQEVPIMCKVSENSKSNEKITNIADITKYLDENKKPANDRDSSEDNVKLPDNKELSEYNKNQEDDDDYEKLVVKIFDLALRKWVTQAIVIANGQETVTQTGHDPWDNPEEIVKVELHRKKINQTTVKFRYSIRVYNQGEIAGYAKEVTDYIPEGLKFVAEDNSGWTDEGNNVISTRQLENTLLQPGEYADIDVVLTWINNENNMGLKNNTAEISEDYNECGVPDIDSTPDNQKPGEDDIDDAPVMLSLLTGQVRIYLSLVFVILITIASGIILIKKFVL